MKTPRQNLLVGPRLCLTAGAALAAAALAHIAPAAAQSPLQILNEAKRVGTQTKKVTEFLGNAIQLPSNIQLIRNEVLLHQRSSYIGLSNAELPPAVAEIAEKNNITLGAERHETYLMTISGLGKKDCETFLRNFPNIAESIRIGHEIIPMPYQTGCRPRWTENNITLELRQ